MNDFDPLKDAFAERSAAANTLDVESGLAGVHRHNAPGRRMAKAGGALMVGLIALGGAGIALSGGGDDVRTEDLVAEEAEVETPDGSIPEPGDDVPTTDVVPTPSTIPSTNSTTPTTEPGSAVDSPPPALIITDASTSVWVDGESYDMGIGPVVDAIDFAGGVIFETDDAIWYYPANALSPRKLVEAQPAGSVDLLEVEVDAENADYTVFFTEVLDDGQPSQWLSKLALGTDTGVQRIAQVGGVEYGVIAGGVGGQVGDHSLVALVGSDGPCTRLRTYDATTGAEVGSEDRCIPEGGGDFSNDEMYRAVDLTHDGGVVWADDNDLHNDQTGDVQSTVEGTSKWIDIWGDWAVVARRGQAPLVELTNLASGDVVTIDDLPVNLTSARPLRSSVELAGAPDFESFMIDSANYRVINVADDDVLNIRSGPGVDYAIQGGIPNGDIVTTSGNAARLPGGAEWYEIDINGLGTGWLNARYLELLETGGGIDDLPCQVEGADPANGLLPQSSAASASDADHISSLNQTTISNDCVRTVIEFGKDFDFSNSGPQTDMPGGISVVSSADGNSILVEFPAAIINAVPGEMRSGTAVVSGNGVDLAVVEILAGPHGAAAYFDPDARVLVIDYVALPIAPDQLPVPLADGAGVIIRNVEGYSDGPNGPTIEGAARVRGFARPFEAQLNVEMLDANGDLVNDVLWNSGRSDEAQGSGYFGPMVPFMVWGAFDITFEGLATGDYTLRFSGNAGAADNPTWLELDFTVP